MASDSRLSMMVEYLHWIDRFIKNPFQLIWNRSVANIYTFTIFISESLLTHFLIFFVLSQLNNLSLYEVLGWSEFHLQYQSENSGANGYLNSIQCTIVIIGHSLQCI